jgi:hypothetical protein
MSSSNWWADKLSGQQVPTSRPTAPTGPVPTVRYVPEGNVTSAPLNYDQNEDLAATKAKSSTMASRCPECASGNYMKIGTQSNSGGQFDVYRCYDCGYPKTQSGSGGGLPSDSSGPATPAKQVSKGNNFNPGIIVDRIG